MSKTLVDLVGNTPLVLLKKYSTPQVKIYAKLEGANPGGSVKDRPAYAMILDAQKKGILKPDSVIFEATSGNTGIGIAMLAAYFGYKFVAAMPESVSLERRALLKLYGAEIMLTDGTKGTDGAIAFGKQFIAEHPGEYVVLNQYENQANIDSHYYGTGAEIIKDMPTITHFVAGMGTGGTLMGVGKRLKEYNETIEVIGIEPKKGSIIQGLRNMGAYVPPIYQSCMLDDVMLMTEDEPALLYAREIFKREGLSVGISSGAALWGALEIQKRIDKGIIVTIFPDRGERYLTTKLVAKE